MLTELPLTGAQVADRLGYTTRTIYAYAKTGRIPAAIDMELPIRMWRWSPVAIAQYEAGDWRAPLPPRRGLEVAS